MYFSYQDNNSQEQTPLNIMLPTNVVAQMVKQTNLPQ